MGQFSERHPGPWRHHSVPQSAGGPHAVRRAREDVAGRGLGGHLRCWESVVVQVRDLGHVCSTGLLAAPVVRCARSHICQSLPAALGGPGLHQGLWVRVWWVLLKSPCQRPEGLPPRGRGAPGGRLPAAPPLACLSSWPGTASLEGMAVDVSRSQDRDSMYPAVPSDSTQRPFSPLAGGWGARLVRCACVWPSAPEPRDQDLCFPPRPGGCHGLP